MNKITSSARNEAYQTVLPFVGGLKERILELVRARPSIGYTAEEAWDALRQTEPSLALNNVRSRVTELFGEGKLFPHSKRKNFKNTVNIAVWKTFKPGA